MEFAWSAPEADFRLEVREFLESELPEHWFHLVPGEEPASEFTIGFCKKLGAAGLLAPHWPVEFGGRNASAWQFIVLGEELWRAGEPRGAQYMNVNWIGPAIMAAGTAEQKDYHLNRITAGDVIWCQGFSEPHAGTDLAALSLTATRDGDEYVLDGTKIWTSYAQWAEYCFVLARTDPDSSGSEGISVFLVPTASAGFTIEAIPSVLDVHIYHRLTFDAVRVSHHTRLGEENRGWDVVREALSHERVGGPRYARAQMVLDQLRQRTVEDGRWAREDVRARWGAARGAIDAARILAYRVIDDRGKSRDSGVVINLARVAIVRSERAVAELALDYFPDEAAELGSIPNSQFKTTMIAGLGSGSVEVQLNLIARAALGSTPGLIGVDLDLSETQRTRLAGLSDAVVAAGGFQRAIAIAQEFGYDRALDELVCADEGLVGADLTLLDRVLLVEEAARLGVGLHATARFLLAPVVGLANTVAAIAIIDDERPFLSTIRHGAVADHVVVVGEAGASRATVGPQDRHEVSSGFGAAYGQVRLGEITTITVTPALPWRTLHHLGLAAELAGSCRAALDITAGHLRTRRQFGVRISSFQGLRHRFSEAEVDAEGASWLVRQAAGLVDETAALGAVVQACTAAGRISPDVHQLCGAQGFMTEFTLPLWTMRLQAIRAEIGGITSASERYASSLWA